MSPQDPPPKKPASREDRLAKALRDNLSRRKALARAKRQRDSGDPAAAPPVDLARKDDDQAD